MKICLIGKNLTNLVLAKNLSKKNLNVDILFEKNKENKLSQRTLAISKENFNYLLKISNKIQISKWPIKNIKIYNDTNNQKELAEFKNNNKENFFLIKYLDILNSFENICKIDKKIKFKKIIYNSKLKSLLKNKNYSLVINSDKNNFYNIKNIEKNYDSIAYTGILEHELKKINFEAIQIFTKYGPLAFLPLSKTKTSIVFSVVNNYKLSEAQINNLIKQYNLNYKIMKIGKLEKAKIKFSMPRNYYYKNKLIFGDILHTIHPLAGQGFNMTIRDIKVLSNLIDEKIDLGLELNESLFYDFQKKIKHLNYTFGLGIDFIYEFFKIDNKTNNFLSNSIFNILGKNKLFNKYANLIADKGIYF